MALQQNYEIKKEGIIHMARGNHNGKKTPCVNVKMSIYVSDQYSLCIFKLCDYLSFISKLVS